MFKSNRSLKPIKLGHQTTKSKFNLDLFRRFFNEAPRAHARGLFSAAQLKLRSLKHSSPSLRSRPSALADKSPPINSLKNSKLPRLAFIRRWHVLFLGVIFFGVSWILLGQHFTIKQISFEAEHLICDSPDDIQKVANLKGKNIFSVSTAQIEAQVKNKFICIQEVTITKQYPSTINIVVTGRLPAAIVGQITPPDNILDYSTLEATASSQAALLNWQISLDAPSFLYVDSTGLMFSPVNSDIQLEKFYLVGQEVNINQRLDPMILKSALFVIMQLRKDDFSILDTRIDRVNNLLVNSDTTKLIFSLNRDVERQLASLHLIWQKAKMNSKLISSLDLRFDRPVVVYQK